jgi:uncharacterized protein (DUF2252 family)
MGTTERAGIGRSRPVRRVEHPTVEERAARGRAARAHAPRGSMAEFRPPEGRPDPIQLLEEQARDRVPELVPIRYGRMMVSPFTFYRGAALVMASDLATAPSPGLRVQLCGDAHLSNFGVFGTPERRLVFDINDFDETLPGPFEWDVKRLAASFAIAARHMGFTGRETEEIVRGGVRRYRTAMAEFAQMGNLEVFYASPDAEQILAPYREGLKGDPLAKVMTRNADRVLAKARSRDSRSALERFAHTVEGEPRIAADPPLIEPIRDLLGEGEAEAFIHWTRGVIRDYRRTLSTDRRRLLESYRVVDIARKVVGVGSVGTGAWIVLLLGRDDDDPLFLQLKEAPPSVLERFLGRSEYRNGGHRVVAGQRVMQAVSDIFLGWIHLTRPDGTERDFYVRQLRDWKGSVDVDRMVSPGMRIYADLCGWTLARAHARSGDRVAIAAYLGSGEAFDRAITAFADAYAERNEADHAALTAAVESGRITALQGL